MPLSLRFVVPLALALAAIAYAVVPRVDRLTFQWFVRDLDTRGALIAKTAQEPLAELVSEPDDAGAKVLRYFERIIQGQRIYALGYCDRAGRIAYTTFAFPEGIRCSTSEAAEERNWVLHLENGPLHVSANRIATADGEGFGELIIVHDMSFVQRRSADTKKYVLYLFAAIATAVAPSRSTIDEYQNLDAKVRALAARINQRFGRPGYQPIVLRIEHHDAAQVYELYRAAELCYVSSLHDGMNLVAKEFVAARDDEHGVLILSQFTGAARELSESLIVNPYHTEQSAAARHLALTMSADEQRARMRSMRTLVLEFNVYRWAGRMLMDAARRKAGAG